MTHTLSHERCSELLPEFLEGELSSDAAEQVEAHLASCQDCRAEQRALEALTASVEGLSVGERAALERSVMAGISQEGDAQTVVPLAPRRGIGLRVAGALGAAATVAVIGTLAYLGTSGGSDEAGTAGGETQTADRAVENDGAGGRDRRGKKGKVRGEGLLAGTDTDLKANEESVADAGSAPQVPIPTFRVERKPLTGQDLQKRGESSLESVRVAASYTANGDRGSRTMLEQLVDAADRAAGAQVASQVEECARQVLETSDPTVPTFGSIGALDGRDVLVLGFAWTRARSGPLDRYMVWAWERGSCDITVDFVEGRIDTAN